MDKIFAAAASGLRARMETLDLLANNIANAATSGYKGDREAYGVYRQRAIESAFGNSASLPTIDGQWTDFSQGQLQPTGNSLDLAIKGNGLFSVNGPSGPLYTRNGNFKLDQDGVLTAPEGYAVRMAGGETLQVESRAPIEVTEDGTVRQSGQTLGRLEIVTFGNPETLVKQGENYFRDTDSDASPAEADAATVVQGHLEASNVSTAESAVRLVGVMRQFEMLQKTIAVASEMNRKVLTEVARVDS